MKLEEIGFYTLSDFRAMNSSIISQLWRCELILTSKCNFKCPYCRGMKKEDNGNISREDAFNIVKMWASNGLKNIRFSGGEPTLWQYLPEIVEFSKLKNVERIALSTNGSDDLDYYMKLAEIGVNDFSISLDSCCSSIGKKMSGGINIWDKVIFNIKELSKIMYTTVGLTLTEDNSLEVNNIIEFASNLGVRDIRIIPAAQISKNLSNLHISKEILDIHPILKYRYSNFRNGKKVRGLSSFDSNKCKLVLDDMAVLNNKHYPCIIYMREHGNPIGIMNNIENVRNEREYWYKNHNCFNDKICRNNCLDVCVDFNNKGRRWDV